MRAKYRVHRSTWEARKAPNVQDWISQWVEANQKRLLNRKERKTTKKRQRQRRGCELCRRVKPFRSDAARFRTPSGTNVWLGVFFNWAISRAGEPYWSDAPESDIEGSTTGGLAFGVFDRTPVFTFDKSCPPGVGGRVVLHLFLLKQSR